MMLEPAKRSAAQPNMSTTGINNPVGKGASAPPPSTTAPPPPNTSTQAAATLSGAMQQQRSDRLVAFLATLVTYPFIFLLTKTASAASVAQMSGVKGGGGIDTRKRLADFPEGAALLELDTCVREKRGVGLGAFTGGEGGMVWVPDSLYTVLVFVDLPCHQTPYHV